MYYGEMVVIFHCEFCVVNCLRQQIENKLTLVLLTTKHINKG